MGTGFETGRVRRSTPTVSERGRVRNGFRRACWLAVVQTFAVVLLLVGAGVAQRYDGEAKKNLISHLEAVPAAAVKVCTAAATGTPCSPGATLYTDSGLGTPTGSSTLTADANGNYHFYAQPGLYMVQETDPVTGVTFTKRDQVVSSSAVPNWIDVGSLGAACDGSTDDNTILHAAGTAATAAKKFIKLPDGKQCNFSVTLTFSNASNWGIIGGPGSKLKYTGSGDTAISIDGTGTTNGAASIVIRDVALDAPSGQHCLHLIKVTRSEFTNVDCRGANAEAYVLDFAVSNNFNNLTASSNNGAFTHTPTGGVLITNATASSANNLFNMARFEGIAGNGIHIVGSNNNGFQFGTSEGNTGTNGRGVLIEGTSGRNLFYGLHMEVNAAANDIELKDGAVIRGTRFDGVEASKLYIGTSSKETAVDGGIYTAIETAAGSLLTTLKGSVNYGTLTTNGVCINRYGENAATQNTLCNAQVGTGVFIDDSGPRTNNNIPYRGKLSGGADINLLWLTAADQTLLQYLSGSAIKFRDQNGNVRATIDDSGTTIAGILVAQSDVNLTTKKLISVTAPTISSGFGTSPSVTANNGTAAFTVNVGTGGTSSSGVISLPVASVGWNCMVNNNSASAAHRADNTVQTASTTNSVTIESQTKSTGAAVAWTASDALRLNCFAY
jgi:hypothetical protein